MNAPGRVPSLTGMRWLAALSVFAFHAFFGPDIFPGKVFSDFVVFTASKAGYIGVAFFFMLSGFVLTWSARPDDTAPKFWRRRFFKIWPNHVVTLLVAVAVLTYAAIPVRNVIPNLLLVQAWSPDPEVAFSVNGVSWSLSCEVFFYLCFPLWLTLINRLRPERLWYWAGGVVVAVLCVPLAAPLLPDNPVLPWEPTPIWEYWSVYLFPVTRMLEFVLGILLARIVLSGRWLNVNLWVAGATVVAGYVAALFLPYYYGFAAATVIPFALVIPAAAVADIQGRRSWLGSPVMVWLGTISFAFYLLHRLTLATAVGVFGRDFAWNTTSAIGIVVVALAVTIVLSWILYTFVEKPMLRRFATSTSSSSSGRTTPASRQHSPS